MPFLLYRKHVTGAKMLSLSKMFHVKHIHDIGSVKTHHNNISVYENITKNVSRETFLKKPDLYWQFEKKYVILFTAT